MIVPHESIDQETLISLVESFVLREGTDYGNEEISLAKKVEQILSQIKAGKLVITYSELHENVNIMPMSEFKA